MVTLKGHIIFLLIAWEALYSKMIDSFLKSTHVATTQSLMEDEQDYEMFKDYVHEQSQRDD